MGIERTLNLLEKQLKDLPPEIAAHQGKPYMRDFLRKVIYTYDAIKEEERIKRYPDLPLSWYHD